MKNKRYNKIFPEEKPNMQDSCIFEFLVLKPDNLPFKPQYQQDKPTLCSLIQRALRINNSTVNIDVIESGDGEIYTLNITSTKK